MRQEGSEGKGGSSGLTRTAYQRFRDQGARRFESSLPDQISCGFAFRHLQAYPSSTFEFLLSKLAMREANRQCQLPR